MFRVSLGLRFGYSAVCWVVGIGAYVSALISFPHTGHRLSAAHGIYFFYEWMALPIMCSVGLVCVVIRPFFLLSAARLYSDVFDVRADIEDDLWEITADGQRGLSWITWAFLALLGGLLVAVFFPDRIGLTELIGRLAH